MRSEYQQKVHQFRKGAGQWQSTIGPTFPPVNHRQLAARLIAEEAIETVESLGFYLHSCPTGFYLSSRGDLNKHDAVVDAVDGCCDVIYVALGCMDMMGVDDHRPLIEVCDNNLLKLQKGYIDENGKLIKPKDHPAPDIRGAIYAKG